MPIDTRQPGTPGWWLNRLITRLGDRQPYYDLFDRYYRGDANLPEGAEGCRHAYRRLQQKARLNFGELVVEATRERMMVTGFRTGDDRETDDTAWRYWQANSLDADQALVDRPTLSMGDGYVIVGPVDPELGAPLITPEDPRQVITEHDPTRRRKVTAALKVFVDDVFGVDRAYLYLPGRVIQAARPNNGGGLAFTSERWEWTSDAALTDANGQLINQVPVVRFANRSGADLSVPGRSELDGAIDTLDRINHMVLQRVVIATMQAFRQRAIKGVPIVDEAGKDIDYSGIFSPDPGALWLLPETAEMWESQQVDLTPVLSSVRHDIQDLAASTRTPLFYLTPDAANGSAEGASLAREGLIHKVLDRIAQAGESWERTIALAFAFAGDLERASQVDTEVVWQPPERFSLAEKYDAAAKAQAAGVPWRSVMADVLQFSPQQVARMETERAAEAFLTAPIVTGGPAQ